MYSTKLTLLIGYLIINAYEFLRIDKELEGVSSNKWFLINAPLGIS